MMVNNQICKNYGLRCSYELASLVSQRWEEGLLNRVLADFRPILQFAQQG